MSWGRWSWPRYVPVAERRRKAERRMKQLAKKGLRIQPVRIEGRNIARTFWGEGWCDHLESFSDFSNRLPRGRTYVRNGSVCHLDIQEGRVVAKVSGSSIYDVDIRILRLAANRWKAVKKRCAGRVGSLLDLLQGRLSSGVMEVMTDRKSGIFPRPAEIRLGCSCPDWAVMCKHVAAVLYGIGARLDERPELLFLLRGVDHEELIAEGAEAAGSIAGGKARKGRRRLDDGTLDEVFGIDIEDPGSRAKVRARTARSKPKARPRGKSGSRSRKPAEPAPSAKRSAGKQGVRRRRAAPPKTRKGGARSRSSRVTEPTPRRKKPAGKAIRATSKAPRKSATPPGGPEGKAGSRSRKTAGSRTGAREPGRRRSAPGSRGSRGRLSAGKESRGRAGGRRAPPGSRPSLGPGRRRGR